ncbi:MAG: fibronectin type III domain-containing protein [Planctomycetes bacterium]|nr:fibronectin type III domain-containing protein [Planctomycetota bacterium]
MHKNLFALIAVVLFGCLVIIGLYLYRTQAAITVDSAGETKTLVNRSMAKAETDAPDKSYSNRTAKTAEPAAPGTSNVLKTSVPDKIKLPPKAPSNLTALSHSSAENILSFQDNSDNEDGFIMERKNGLNGTYAEYMFVSPSVTPPASSMVYIPDTSLPSGTDYYYRVRAHNAAGQSACSNEANAATLLETPTGLTVTAVSPYQINLSWVDNSQAKDGFIIERWGSEPGEAAGFKQIATVGQNVVSFSDNNLSPCTHYAYCVKAYRQNNSSYSSESTGTITLKLSTTNHK